MGAAPDPFAARLADIRGRLEQPTGFLRLPIMESILEDLEAAFPEEGPAGVASRPELAVEIELLVDVLSRGRLGETPEAVGRRLRLVEVLRRLGGGRLPVRAFDDADAFGAELQTMLATDAELASSLGTLHPLLMKATAVAPSSRWLAEARGLLGRHDPEPLASAIRRTLASLVRAEIVSRPDLLVGGLRLPNQRLARGLLWFASVALERPADVLAAVGLRMGTSGRRDAVVRDTAVANTCAALLGASSDQGAAAALASMRVQVVNRNVLKQVDRALGEIASRAGAAVATVIEEALPDFGLDADGRLELEVGDARAFLTIAADGGLEQRWRSADGRDLEQPPAELVSAMPAGVADVGARVAAIGSTLTEERRRMDGRLASERSWREDAWRRRFVEHPIGGFFGRRLIWVVGAEPPTGTPALPDGERWVGVDGRPLAAARSDPRQVWLWHPADADPEAVAAWRAVLAAAGIEQPVPQADREAFRPLDRDRDLAADRRFAGRIVDHAQLRAILRERGWAVPALGSWDQGDEATAWRAFDGDLRAELRYQTVERLPTAARHERARLVAVRFVEAGADSAAPGEAGERSRSLADVAPRIYSEAIRDVSLAAVVAESAGHES